MRLFKETIYFVKLVGLKKFFIVLSLTLLASFFDLVGIGAFIPLLTNDELPLIGNLINRSNFLKEIFNNKLHLSLIIIFFFLFRAIISFFLTRSVFNISINLLNILSTKILKLFFNAEYKFTQNFKNMEIVNDLVNVTRIYIDDFFKQLLKILSDLIPLLIIMIIAISLINSFSIFLIIFIIVITSLLLRKFIFSNFNFYAKELVKNYEKIVSTLDVSFRNLRELKFLNIENYLQYKLNQDFKKINSLEVEYNSRNQLPKYFLELTMIIVFVTIFLVNYYGDNDPLLIEKLVVIGIASIRLIPMVSNIMISFGKFKFSSVSSNKLYELIRYLEKNQAVKNKKVIKSFEDKRIAISANNIFFKYKKENIIKNLSFNIFKNEINLIYGESGSGKTTLTNIVSNLYKPSSGSIHYNQNYKFSLLPQKPLLFEDNFLFNVILDNSFYFPKVKNVLELSSMSKFVTSLADLDIQVGSSSRNLSEGEIQRLAIARILYKNSDVIIFDEPTSSLDKKNKKIILDLIKKIKNKKIVIVVSHDPSLIKLSKNKINLTFKK